MGMGHSKKSPQPPPAQGWEGRAVGNWSCGHGGMRPCHRHSGAGPRLCPPASPPHAGFCWYLPLDEPVPRLWRCRVWSRPRTGQMEGTSTQPPSRCEAQGLQAVILPHRAEQKGGFQTLIRLTSSIGIAGTRCLLAYCTFYEVPLKTITKPDQTPPEGHPQSILQGC